MNPEVKRKWISALRSKKYKQTTGRLKNGDCFCCLGVLTDLYLKEHGLEHEWEDLAPSDDLPPQVEEWAGVDANPILDEKVNNYGDPITCITANDTLGYSFKKISYMIEKAL
jgi:hypothetical protein